eukprot:TRINITY_DN137_c2_g1_i3.p1 TRINITY_DN137_c2_g1~~TRINITY_DN137_c2_g1_i3.p1  ORF type:complete len:232 (-),score=-9.95 TRINITY_DN137_c2_g1_i3:91-786(-)
MNQKRGWYCLQQVTIKQFSMTQENIWIVKRIESFKLKKELKFSFYFQCGSFLMYIMYKFRIDFNICSNKVDYIIVYDCRKMSLNKFDSSSVLEWQLCFWHQFNQQKQRIKDLFELCKDLRSKRTGLFKFKNESQRQNQFKGGKYQIRIQQRYNILQMETLRQKVGQQKSFKQSQMKRNQLLWSSASKSVDVQNQMTQSNKESSKTQMSFYEPFMLMFCKNQSLKTYHFALL